MRWLNGMILVLVFSLKGQNNFLIPPGLKKTGGLELPALFNQPANIQPLPWPATRFSNTAEFHLHWNPMPVAFFCRMENRFRRKFHVFLKIRMGNDDSYKELTDHNRHIE